jgi:hypothetical protein
LPLSAERAVEQAAIVKNFRDAERGPLDQVRRYWKGRQALPAVIPTASPREVKVMARSSRVNIMPIVINSLVQSMFVDGFRAKNDADDLEVWKVWQANRMDAKQTAIHRAESGYGTAYAIVLPGDTMPVIRARSPRQLTAVYGEDPDWPLWALDQLGNGLWRLLDDEAIYYVSERAPDRNNAVSTAPPFDFISYEEHGAGVTPVVRFLDEDDLDADDEVPMDGQSLGRVEDRLTRGQVAPLMDLQDQIDLTTFGLQIAQHFGAFRQRYIIGWVAESESDKLKVGANRFMTFDENPDEINIGEFDQTNLDGYIKSREASLRHAATLSQTPVHELIGELVNLSAEALAAAEAGKDRKVEERQALAGEAHEQVFWLVGRYSGIEVPDDGQVVWRDTSARAFAATVDGLGKLATMLQIPPQELWEKIPGVTKQDVERFKASKGSGDSFQQLATMLDRQANGNGATPPAPAFG